MKSIIIYIPFLLLLYSKEAQAQFENSNSGNTTGKISTIISTNASEIERPNPIKIDATSGFQKAFEKEQKDIKEKEKETDFNNKGIISAAKLSEERFLKSFKKINGMYQYPVIDQDLGSFRTDSKSVNIICRDFQYPDGDRVTIFVNEIPVVVNIVLRQQYQKFNIPLEKGMNKIIILALNQGTSGPNTAAFKVFNDAGMLLSSNEWNLATGAKATLLIAKEQ
ncbi:hypothetical protein [Polaribacter sp. HL-MS24]|uniref:hypothetical protein n=1 Tax=Polaribacter sp. HL-MS24 TaxID=3077735 RepID=UPI002934B860|nr:hypothetical protein [Polaribacter sp. HL-MS24]WOC39735.1 hypothetical protein RRF69_08740 [Polaribacter sp. HL-MS24]